MPIYKFNLEKARRDQLIKPTNESIFELIFSLLKSCKDLHSKNIIHRDIKPNNIFLWPIGHMEGYFYVLADFEIAKNISNNKNYVTGGTATYCFMAPEQMIEFQAYPESDIWGIGATILWFITSEYKSLNILSMKSDYKQKLEKDLENYPLFKDFLISTLDNEVKNRPTMEKCFEILSTIEKQIYKQDYSEPCRCSNPKKHNCFTDKDS